MLLPKLGIDQSKKSFDACLLVGEKIQKRKKFSNDDNGFRALCEWLVGFNVQKVHMSVESTGRYGNKLAQFMHKGGNIVSVVNPKRVSNHRKARGIRNKTDSNDAFVNADYARVFEPGPWSPPEEHVLELRDLVGQIELLKKHRAAYKNRAQCGLESEYVMTVNLELIKHLNDLLETLEERAMAIVRSDEKLSKNYDILLSLPGIGPVIALGLVSQINFDNFRTGRDLAAFLGLSPAISQSGTTENRSYTSKEGNTKLRALLKSGAASAKRGKFYKPFINRLTLKGKKKGSIVNAIARKILLIAHACIRRGTPFSPDYEHPLASSA